MGPGLPLAKLTKGDARYDLHLGKLQNSLASPVGKRSQEERNRQTLNRRPTVPTGAFALSIPPSASPRGPGLWSPFLSPLSGSGTSTHEEEGEREGVGVQSWRGEAASEVGPKFAMGLGLPRPLLLLLPPLLLLLLGFSSTVAAVYRDEVDDVDFHYALVGLPLPHTTFFHRPLREERASLIYSLSDVAVVGAINPSNGNLVWRRQLKPNDHDVAPLSDPGYLVAADGENWLAAASGSSLHALEALTGRTIWQMDFNGSVSDLKLLQTSDTSRLDLLALFRESGISVLRRLHGSTGAVIWETRETGSQLPLHVTSYLESVYIVGLDGSDSSYKMCLTSLDPITGARLDHWSLGAKGDIAGPSHVTFVGQNSAAPIVAWTDANLAKLSINILGSRTKQEFALPPATSSLRVHAPRLVPSQPHFLVHARASTGPNDETADHAEVFHADLKTGHVKRAFTLPPSRGHGTFATSSDGTDVYFTRLVNGEMILFSSAEDVVLARWPIHAQADLEPAHAVAEVVKKPGHQEYAVRSAVVTTSDDWSLVRNGELDWTRHEGLSASVAAVWADIWETENLAKVLAEEAHTSLLSAYLHRLTRHARDLQHLPGYLADLARRAVEIAAGRESVGGSRAGLYRDSAGFNKVLVLVTGRGRFYGLDTGNGGKIAWSKTLFPSRQGKNGPLQVRALTVDEDRGTISMYGDRGEFAILDSATGNVRQLSDSLTAPATSVSSVAIVDIGTAKTLLALGPDRMPIDRLPDDWDPELTVVIRDNDGGLQGVRFRTDGTETVKQVMWQLQLLPGQRIATVARLPDRNPIASIGRVLGDRSVLYKYINANSVVVAVADEATSSLSLRLVDTISGQILASHSYQGVDATEPVSCTMAENWYACSFFADYALNDGSGRSVKGYQLMVTDLYESPEPNSRGPLADAANQSSLKPIDSPVGVPLPWLVSQSYMMSQPLATLTVTQTRQGISTKQLIAYLPESHGILGLARQLLDPRRPVGRDPTPAEVEAEGLIRYAPALEVDPRAVVSHQRDILGVVGIVVTTATVESVGLLAAYGIDVYATRVAPSGVFDFLGKGFGKLTLVGTVLALLAGVVILSPMVSSARTRQSSSSFFFLSFFFLLLLATLALPSRPWREEKGKLLQAESPADSEMAAGSE